MDPFKAFRKDFDAHFNTLTASNTQLFIADIDPDKLWQIYLDSFPAGTNEIYKERREHDCSCCRAFLKNYGGIVYIENGKMVSLWDFETSQYPYQEVINAMKAYVDTCTIKNVFISPERILGQCSSNKQMMEDGTVKTWYHFFAEVPRSMALPDKTARNRKLSNMEATLQVFKRSMEELSLDAGETVLELIDQGSLYRGDEFKKSVSDFVKAKKQFEKVDGENRLIYCWNNMFDNSAQRIRNTAIGTLLINLSEGVDIDKAVRQFERVVAPANYKRPQPIYTKAMIEAARNKIAEMGFAKSLQRRHATISDISVNDIIFVNRDVREHMKEGDVFDELMGGAVKKSADVKKFDKVEEISIEDFIKNVVPKAREIQVMLEGRHERNLMNIVAPVNKDAPSMFKWGNNFSWSYNGNIADSQIKENVKNAGGNVNGIMRFSIQWNENNDNVIDFDAHCICPDNSEIAFHTCKYPKWHKTGGTLDVDIITPRGVAVENIYWPNTEKMRGGSYTFYVHNYFSGRSKAGFKAQIECDGEIHEFEYDKPLDGHQSIHVCKVEFNKKQGGFTINPILQSNQSTRSIWGVDTNQFTRVKCMMFSPNFWHEKQVGNKHYCFILEGCKNEDSPRGFFNEFLQEDLNPHRKVFEALASNMKVDYSDEQLCGVGFSSTQRNHLIVKVDGKFQRTLKVKF